MVKRNRRRSRLKVTADGKSVVAHVGARLLSDLAEEVGLTDGLSLAMASTKQRRRGHDRGLVLVDLAVMIADGGETISDLAVLRHQPDLFGVVASTPTAGGPLRPSTPPPSSSSPEPEPPPADWCGRRGLILGSMSSTSTEP